MGFLVPLYITCRITCVALHCVGCIARSRCPYESSPDILKPLLSAPPEAEITRFLVAVDRVASRVSKKEKKTMVLQWDFPDQTVAVKCLDKCTAAVNWGDLWSAQSAR